jgi:peptidoglycan/LPS O-acetylase OafA/YrhL
MDKQHRFEFLDGLRGIAAFAVVIMHYTQQHGKATAIFASAGLAVDLFFCLSGFVIAWSYYQKLLDGMSFSVYLKKRLVRLYPMFLIGSALGILGFLIKYNYGTNTYSLLEITKAAVVNSFYLPYFVNRQADQIHAVFLLNPPSWSLFFELIANVIFIFTIRFSKTLLVVLTIILGTLLIYAGAVFHTSPGWSTANFIGGFPRVGYSFMLGVLIFKFFDSSEKIPKVSLYWIVFALTIFLLVPSFPKWVYYWLLGALFLMPLIVLLGARVDVKQPFLGKIFVYLGWISYPIYCLHSPLLAIWESISPVPEHYNIGLLMLFPITIVITHLLAKYIDNPVRAWLSKL